MTTAVAQINIPFELLAEAVTTLNTEHKVKLWKLLGQEVAESQRITMMLIIDANILQQIPNYSVSADGNYCVTNN